MIACALVTHGPVADALTEAARSIIGDVKGVHSVSVSPLSLEEIHRRLKKIAERKDCKDGLIIMATLKGGSCWNAARKIALEYPNVRVLSGVNLPMLLSLLTKRDRLALDQLAEAVCRDGVSGIVAHPDCK